MAARIPASSAHLGADPLRDIRAQVESGAFPLSPDARQAVISRVDELVSAFDAVRRALARLPKPDIAEAAAKLAFMRYVTGHGWEQYAAANAASTVAAAIRVARDRAAAEPIELLGRHLAARAPEPIKRIGEGAYALPCAVCGGDAIALTVQRVISTGPDQMVVTSLSPVTVFRALAGPRMADLLAILDAGDVAAVVRHLRDTQPGGCDAWCAECDRVYCKTHYAVEAQWSGSWHEATYATCPLGHEHTID